jgi:hypothetical protein
MIVLVVTRRTGGLRPAELRRCAEMIVMGSDSETNLLTY